MCSFFFSLFVVNALLFGADDAAKDAVKKERQLLFGDWQVVHFIRDGGRPLTEDQLERLKTSFDRDGTLTVTENDDVLLRASTVIDPSKKPKTIDVKYLDGDRKGQTSLGIYELKGRTLKFCRAEPGHLRPRDFSSKRGDGHILFIYKRVD